MSYPFCYKVVYLRLADTIRESLNGPWDYYRNALSERDELFEIDKSILKCWVRRTDGKIMGKVLER